MIACYGGAISVGDIGDDAPRQQEKPHLMTILSRAIPFLLAATFTLAAHAQPVADTVMGQRGDVRITYADLQDALAQLEPGVRAQVTATPQSLANFTRERLLNKAVLSEALSKKWETRPEVVRRVNETRDAVITQTYLMALVPPDPAFPSEAEVTAAYETNKPHLMVPRQYRIAQIVLTEKAGMSPQELEEVRKKAVDLRAQAVRPKADFADLAKKFSQEPQSADKGGDVGWLREPDMIPAVKDVVTAMTDGGVSQPVHVPDGWHILKLLAVKPAGELPLIEAKPQIVTALRQARAQRMMRAYLDEMLKSQPIQLNEIELAKDAGK